MAVTSQCLAVDAIIDVLRGSSSGSRSAESNGRRYERYGSMCRLNVSPPSSSSAADHRSIDSDSGRGRDSGRGIDIWFRGGRQWAVALQRKASDPCVHVYSDIQTACYQIELQQQQYQQQRSNSSTIPEGGG